MMKIVKYTYEGCKHCGGTHIFYPFTDEHPYCKNCGNEWEPTLVEDELELPVCEGCGTDEQVGSNWLCPACNDKQESEDDPDPNEPDPENVCSCGREADFFVGINGQNGQCSTCAGVTCSGQGNCQCEMCSR